VYQQTGTSKNRTKSCPQSALTVIIIGLIVNSRDERHLNPDQNGRQTWRKRVTPMKSQSAQAEKKLNKKTNSSMPLCVQQASSGIEVVICFQSVRPPGEKVKQSWHTDMRIPLRDAAAAARRRSRKKS
jgi:hypothetical protein